ncbi:hypothetical protein [Aliivibrio fischeri]|uniref:hypothetical protein n=1 Tax=Aliivibrio fischeri TaxID=668 RepID=UPI000A7CF17D|nr:hypothetical protein [Aliivibrio fischeri]
MEQNISKVFYFFCHFIGGVFLISMMLKLGEAFLIKIIDDFGFTSTAFAMLVSTLWGNIGWDYLKSINKHTKLKDVIYEVVSFTCPIAFIAILFTKVIMSIYVYNDDIRFSMTTFMGGDLILITAFSLLCCGLICLYYDVENKKLN